MVRLSSPLIHSHVLSFAHLLIQFDEVAAARCTSGPALRYGSNGKHYKEELQ